MDMTLVTSRDGDDDGDDIDKGDGNGTTTIMGDTKAPPQSPLAITQIIYV